MKTLRVIWQILAITVVLTALIYLIGNTFFSIMGIKPLIDSTPFPLSLAVIMALVIVWRIPDEQANLKDIMSVRLF